MICFVLAPASARILAAPCRRCHMLHDRDEHARRRRALGDLFDGPYPSA